MKIKFNAPAARLSLCGFGDLEQDAIAQFGLELGVPVEAIRSPISAMNDRNAGLLGYLQGLAGSVKIGINLASVPLRRDRPILIGSALVALLMAFSLVALIGLAFVDRGATQEDRRIQRRLSQDLVKLQAEQRKVRCAGTAPGKFRSVGAQRPDQ